MAESKKIGEAPEASASPQASTYRVEGLAPEAEIYIPLTCRTVKVGELDQSQLAQLYALKWPHVVKA